MSLLRSLNLICKPINKTLAHLTLVQACPHTPSLPKFELTTQLYNLMFDIAHIAGQAKFSFEPGLAYSPVTMQRPLLITN